MANIKGVSIVSLVKVLRANKEAAANLLPASHQHFLQDRILVSAWYDEEDYKILLVTVGEILRPLVRGDVYEFMGEQGANSDFTTVYQAVVRKNDPSGTVRHFGMIWSMYRDTGRLEIRRIDETHARVLLHDYPNASPETCATLTGYYRALLRLSGASVVAVRLEILRAASQGPTEWSCYFE